MLKLCFEEDHIKLQGKKSEDLLRSQACDLGNGNINNKYYQ